MTIEVEQATASSCPLHVQPFLIEILERGRVMVVVLDSELRIQWANRAFCESLLDGRPASGLSFCELLHPDSARLLGHLVPFNGNQEVLELRHQLVTGHRTIKYHFLPTGQGCVAGVGSDRTEEVELIEQMSALIEDLHREIEHRTELSKELARMATTDFLTGVSNRREFDETLLDEWSRMRRYKSHFALLIVDLDHFKNVNDCFGHQTGDEVLQRVAEALKEGVRSEDMVARYGGEEFAIIALGANAENARELAERLRLRVASARMPAGLPGITITMGIAATSSLPPSANLADLIASADKALYRGKENGRNRVEVYIPG